MQAWRDEPGAACRRILIVAVTGNGHRGAPETKGALCVPVPGRLAWGSDDDIIWLWHLMAGSEIS